MHICILICNFYISFHNNLHLQFIDQWVIFFSHFSYNVTIFILVTPYVFASLGEWSTWRGVDCHLLVCEEGNTKSSIEISGSEQGLRFQKSSLQPYPMEFFSLNLWGFFLNDRYSVFRMHWMISKKKPVIWYNWFKVRKKRKFIVEGAVAESGPSLFLWFIWILLCPLYYANNIIQFRKVSFSCLW